VHVLTKKPYLAETCALACRLFHLDLSLVDPDLCLPVLYLCSALFGDLLYLVIVTLSCDVSHRVLSISVPPPSLAEPFPRSARRSYPPSLASKFHSPSAFCLFRDCHLAFDALTGVRPCRTTSVVMCRGTMNFEAEEKCG